MLVNIDIIMWVFIKNPHTTTQEGKNNHNSRCPCKPCVDSPFCSSLSLLVKSFEEEIQPSVDRVNTARG